MKKRLELASVVAERPAMRTSNQLGILLASILVVLGPTHLLAQPASGEKKQKPPPDEFKSIVSVIEDAYKAPFEVDKDILDELRKQYRDPKPEREGKIFREIRRLYTTTAEQEDSILSELRRAYAAPSAEQEERLFFVIRRNGQVPLGTIPMQVQGELAAKLFRRLDRNEDGILQNEEMSELLQGQRSTWDQNRDGLISPEEYMGYYQAHLGSVSERVASGEIQIKLPRQLSQFTPTSPQPSIAPGESPRPIETRPAGPAPQLPRWFFEFDLNVDGQIGLYEWKKVGRPIAEFTAMDGNQDGFLEAKELEQYLGQQIVARSNSK
jgi:hypothetical protein